MASTTKQGPPRRLAKLLDEQQEPFMLEVYLLERGIRRKSLELQGQVGCFSASKSSKNNNLSKLLKRSFTYHGPNTESSKSSGQFSNIARTLYNRLVSINQVFGLKNSGFLGEKKYDSNHREYKEAVPEFDRFSSDSSSTPCNTCCEGDMEIQGFSSPSKNANHETAPDRVMTQWRFVEENKQCSPVSVLDEIDFLQAIPVYNVRQEETPSASRIRLQKKVPEDSLLSASLWELLIRSRREKTKHPRSKLLLPQYMNSKKALQETRQLLFDCVREVVENQNGKQQRKMRKGQKGLLGPEEIGKIICNNLKTWGENSADETNTIQLLRMDLISGLAEDQWGGSEACRREISWEIGDGIFEEISDEIVRDITERF